jgi:hypothetical protein
MTGTSAIDRMIGRSPLWLLFFLTFAVNIYFVSPGVGGVPYRFVLSLVVLAGLFLLATRQTMNALSRGKAVLLVILYLGVVGFVLAAVRDGLGDAAKILVANHVQAVVIFIATVTGTLLIGRRSMTTAFVAAVLISSLFALLQAVGIRAASDIRDHLGTFYFQDARDVDAMEDRFAGLSYSAIFLGNQLCLAFAVLVCGTVARMQRTRRTVGASMPTLREWMVVIAAALLVFVVSLVEGNRSPILGVVVFFAFAITTRDRRLLFVVVPAVLAVLFFSGPIKDLLAQSGLRAMSTGDKSELARNPLMIYGWRLFMAHPLGYGITFDSKLLVHAVNIGDLSANANLNGLTDLFEDRDLHNYWLAMLNMYGLFLLPAAYFVIRGMIRYWQISLAFVPYMVHVTFHNGAPLINDYMFWVPLGIFVGSIKMPAAAGQRIAALAGQRARPSRLRQAPLRA